MMIHNLNNENHVRFSMLLLSVLVHAGLFIQVADAYIRTRAQAPAPNLSHEFSLNLMLETAKAEPESALEPEPERPPREYTEYTKVTQAESAQKPKKKPKLLKHETYKQSTAPVIAPDVQREHAGFIEKTRQRYLDYLLNHIERHKYYPQSARRRGLEGSIRVSFKLNENGSIEGLDASGEPLILRKAARQAVEQAAPFPVPPPEIDYPVQVSYAMQFRLD